MNTYPPTGVQALFSPAATSHLDHVDQACRRLGFNLANAVFGIVSDAIRCFSDAIDHYQLSAGAPDQASRPVERLDALL